MKRAVLLVSVLISISLFLSCGSSNPSSKTGTSGLKFRALVSQDVSSSTTSAGLIIVDANKDVRARVSVISTGTGSTPRMMVVSNNRKFTLAFSPAANTIGVVNNEQEAMSTTNPISIPGPTESMTISPDNLTGFVAVPTAPVPGGSPGGIVVMNLTAGTISSTVQVPGVHYIVQSPDGSRLLGFSDNSDSVSIVSPFSIVPGQATPCVPAVLPPPANPPVCTTVSGFNRPVFGFFSSDGTTAWILNCGTECGGAPGVTASLQVLDLVNNVTGPVLPIPGGATVGFLNNQTLYVSGNSVQPGVNTCTGGLPTAATSCGRVTVIDVPSLTITGTAIITDGYHNQMNLADGQLFVGSRTCTNIVPANAGAEQRGCLSIVNTNAGNAVVIPPDNGDVTGIQPITGRTIVYVCEGGNFRIYDTTTDKIYTVTSLDLLGDPWDVKLIDF